MDAGSTEDGHRAPRDRDRDPLLTRIRKAADEGRISAADRDIRLRNVGAAQSMSELQMIGRDLDVLEATLTPGAATAPPPVTPPATAQPTFSANPVDVLVDRQRGSFRPGLIVGVAVAAFAIIAAGVIGLFVFSSGGSETSGPELFEPSPIETGDVASPAPEDEPEEEPEERASYGLTRAGLTGFLETYRKEFGTTRTTESVFYPDYAVVRVPVPGKARYRGWIYRNESGFTDFGGIQANFPGTEIVDLKSVDLAALMRNVNKAKATLNVEDISQTYVIVRHLPASDEAPMANIYVSNSYGESGYLSTTIDGRVIRAYPFQSP